MQFNPLLMIRRMLVTKNKFFAYDEFFNTGVNIIRGINSSGKSSIADLIFYGLGGDVTKLKNEAKQCSFVIIEVELSSGIYTLKREIAEGGRKGMDIFSGDYETASNAPLTEWTRYPYNANTKESFYQAIFKEMGMPYSKSEDKNSITMHQLLRMLYVDQMTSPDRLFKFDKFDSPNKRKAIGELVMGVSDFSLYEKRVALQRLESRLDSCVREIKTIHRFFGSMVKSVNEIDENIIELREEIDNLEKDIESACAEEEKDKLNDDEEQQFEGLIRKLQEARESFSNCREYIAKTSFEINDSQLFIKSLNQRIQALKQTRKTINALADIRFVHCPACQHEVTPKLGACSLCGSKHQSNDTHSEFDPTYKVRKEIEFQIAESKLLVEKKQEVLSRKEIELNQVSTDIKNIEREIGLLKRTNKSVSSALRNRISRVGELKNKIQSLNESKEEFAKLYDLYDERDSIQTRVSRLKDEVDRLEKKLSKELVAKRAKLSSSTLDILKSDTGHEDIFVDGKKVEFDFAEDRVTIDDQALFSASSMVYLKNAFRLAMLKSSCQDRSYLYPRFLLMDNIEDKGMEEKRSKLFQREIVRLSESLQVKHQIIFTTSMIDEELNTSKYCVGDYYTKENKSLKV